VLSKSRQVIEFGKTLREARLSIWTVPGRRIEHESLNHGLLNYGSNSCGLYGFFLSNVVFWVVLKVVSVSDCFSLWRNLSKIFWRVLTSLRLC
jgi:hypothetical protein